MNPLSKLRASMIATLATIIGLSTLVLTAVLLLIFRPEANLTYFVIGSLSLVIVIHLLQWLLGPKIIESAYSVKPIMGGRYSWIEDMISRIARESGLDKVPKAMIAEVEAPNAFAYGNVFTGYKVAVTEGLINSLPPEEIEAVVAHEIGHIKHKDVEIMMIVSILPALIFWLGRILMYFGWVGDRDRNQAAILPLIGLGLMAISFIFNFFVLYVSRLREYYADSHAALTIPGGAIKLQRALARIFVISGQLKRFAPNKIASASKFKAFLIADPEEGVTVNGPVDIDEVVNWIKSRPKLMPTELFSTHPDPAKRLRFLDELARSTPYTYV